MTFAIAARCARTGRFALAVASSSPAVAARCAHARAGVGAVATQNITDPTLGPRMLDLMASGASAPDALAALRLTAQHLDYRQVAAIDRDGHTSAFSGTQTLGNHAVAEGRDAVAAGNLLRSGDVPAAMIAAFAADEAADLGDRIVAAMQAGLAAGGEESPVRSAGLLIVDRVPWAVADLRVDWHDDPIGELARLWDLWKPQLDGYVTRALDPAEAPSFGVAGDP